MYLCAYVYVYIYSLYGNVHTVCSHSFYFLSFKTENSSDRDIILEFKKYKFCHHMKKVKKLFCAIIFLLLYINLPGMFIHY